MVECRILYFYEMLTWLKGACFTACFVLLGTGGIGQQPPPAMSFETIDEKRGLSNHFVYCLLQDKRGFIWAGTDYGLNRYDGTSCTGYFAGSGTKNALTDNHVNRLAEDASGNIWVATNRGLTRINPLTGETIHFFSTERDRDQWKELGFQVFADRKGGIWAGNGHFFFRYNRESGTFLKYPVDCGQSTGNTRNFFIMDMMEDKAGQIWLATSYGIKRFNARSGEVKSYHFPEKGSRLIENAVTSLAMGPDGRLLAGTWGGGLLTYNPVADRVDKIPGNTPDRGLNIILDILVSGNTLYLATGGGLVEGEIQSSADALKLLYRKVYRSAPGNERSISDNVVNCLLKDRVNNLWLGTHNNISRADLRLSYFQHSKIFTAGNIPLIPNVLANDPGKPASGNHWVGAEGLFQVKAGRDGLEKMELDRYILNEEGQKVIWDIAGGKKGLWLATTGGLIQFDPKKKRVLKAWYPQTGNPYTLSGVKIWKVYEDRAGRVWVGTIRRGVGILNTANGTFTNFFVKPGERYSLFNKIPTQFFEDAAGNIWFGSDDLLYQYVDQADSFRVIPFRVPVKNGRPITGKPIPFSQDGRGNIRLTCADGIVLYNPKANHFEPMLTGIPFFKPVGAISRDALGHYWFGTTNGLFRWDTSANKLTRFTTNDGLMSNETDGCMVSLPDGTIVAGSPGILTRFSPENLLAKEPAPPVALVKVQVNGRDTSTTFSSLPSLPHQSTLLFSFAALSFGNASQNQYSFMLKGAEKDWSLPVRNNTVTYAKLPAGNYTFMVKGSNSDGVWNPEPVNFSFRIKAPFYLQGWFIALIVVAGGMAIFLFYRYRLSQYLRVERLRMRLATDLHDDIGATLSAISMYTEALSKQVDQPHVAKLLGKIGDDSREMVRAMSDLVWAINPGNDGGEKLHQRMANYAIDLCAAKGVRLNLQQDEKINTQTIGVETRQNVYLIFKEAINNALKYSGCTEINLRTALDGNHLRLVIADNGSGFDENAIGNGNGLINMQHRATNIGGHLTITGNPGKGGCRVELQCPLL